MSTELSENERTVVQMLPATSAEISEGLNCEPSYARDLIASLREKGHEIQNRDGVYGVYSDAAGTSGTASPSEKAQITRKFREKIAEVEEEVASSLEGMAAPTSGVEPKIGDGDLVLHRTDDHFGDEVTDESGDVVFNSEIAERRVRDYFATAQQFVEQHEGGGMDIDRAHLLLGGDLVTNESIYEGQAHDIDENLFEQMDRVTNVYFEQIQNMSEDMEAVNVVCQGGNHGELRAPNSSESANADDIVYMMLDKMVRESDIDNVTFRRTESPYYINFQMRDWNAHLRHGHGSSLEHIGTSAGKQRWGNWLIEHDFDVAFRGHYHMVKEEPVAGIPVHMGGTLSATGDFEESQAMSGRPASSMHIATDNHPTEFTRSIYF